MSDTVLLTWNVTNWITVLLMAILGFAIVSFVSTAYKNHVAAKAA